MPSGRILGVDPANGIRGTLLENSNTNESGDWIGIQGSRFITAQTSDTTAAIEASGKIDIEMSLSEAQPASGIAGTIVFTLDATTKGSTSFHVGNWVRATRTIGSSPVSATVQFKAAYGKTV